MSHPLTDEMCKQIQLHKRFINLSDEDCMRIAYDKGCNDQLEKVIDDEDCMRIAYDKGRDDQLGQVIEWIKECPSYDLDFYSECRRMIADLKKAMRPQEES